MKKPAVIFFLSVFTISIGMAQAPKYYIKKGTWLETLIGSRQELAEEQRVNTVKFKPVMGTWYAIGPWLSGSGKSFGEKFPPEDNTDISAAYGDKKWEARPYWQDGVVINLPATGNASTYLVRTITSDRDTTISGFFGSDDGIKAWLNGALILSRDIDRPVHPNQDVAELTLKKGENKLLLKINNNAGDYGFYFSITGMNPQDVIWSLIEKDFTKDPESVEILWTQKDKIWDEDWNQGDLSPVAKKYAFVVSQISERMGDEILQEASGAVGLARIRSIHNKYIEARKSEFVPLTPKPAAAPKINGAKVFGVRPGAPFQFTIACTGDRPLQYSAENLPKGLELDRNTGIITGSLMDEGEYPVTISAKNSAGSAQRKLLIKCGSQIALTPPMGWNSWNCFAGSVSAAKVKAAADAMVQSGLIDHGWTYINIDDYWETKPGADDTTLLGAPRDSAGFIIPNKRFPDMKALSAYIHGKGLKMGVYSSPGPLTCGGCTASFGYEEKDAQKYGEWGVDYLKYDWCSYNGNTSVLSDLMKPYTVMRNALNSIHRDILFSLCQYGMGNVWEWGGKVGGNCWRTTGDIEDTWESMSGIGFNQAGHEKYAKPGNWNDPDMLVVGMVGWGPSLHPTRLMPNEQYTHISLWCLLSAPLLIGCDMTQLDGFTLSLLTNDDVIDVDQDPLGKQASRISAAGRLEIWSKELEDGSRAVGLFNRGEKREEIVLDLRQLGLTGTCVIRDLWRQKDLGKFDAQFKASVAPHGVVLVKVSQGGE
ncbi:MAG TPA: putative Ig domain-containing protein [Bacteroidota bacterium]|nr:putative Ig domain-containing protein [Bacteroidota bacterium]